MTWNKLVFQTSISILSHSMFGYFRPPCLRSHQQPFFPQRKTLQSFPWQSIKGRVLILLRVWRIQETNGLIWWRRIWADSNSKMRVIWSRRGVDTPLAIDHNRQSIPQPNPFSSALLQQWNTFRLHKWTLWVSHQEGWRNNRNELPPISVWAWSEWIWNSYSERHQ